MSSSSSLPPHPCLLLLLFVFSSSSSSSSSSSLPRLLLIGHPRLLLVFLSSSSEISSYNFKTTVDNKLEASYFALFNFLRLISLIFQLGTRYSFSSLLELSATAYSVSSSNTLPPPSIIHSDLTTPLTPFFSIARTVVSHPYTMGSKSAASSASSVAPHLTLLHQSKASSDLSLWSEALLSGLARSVELDLGFTTIHEDEKERRRDRCGR